MFELYHLILIAAASAIVSGFIFYIRGFTRNFDMFEKLHENYDKLKKEAEELKNESIEFRERMDLKLKNCSLLLEKIKEDQKNSSINRLGEFLENEEIKILKVNQ